MTDRADVFFEQPILNSPYKHPSKHWELDENRQPTGEIIEYRRPVSLISPVPKAIGATGNQRELTFAHRAEALEHGGQQYDELEFIAGVRNAVQEWRESCQKTKKTKWKVTSTTASLLQHWWSHKFKNLKPFFCQVEAAETAIWLTEVAPNAGKKGAEFLEILGAANQQANPELLRLALKLATGAGKTTVMAMLIAWQTVNHVRRSKSPRFTKGFLVVAPSITIKDRLRVLQPNDPDAYYAERELVPKDMLDDVNQANIVITNYHAFIRREKQKLPKGNRDLLHGRHSPPDTKESEGEMIRRVMPGLMTYKNILVLNDEGHHCYRSRPQAESEERALGVDERKEAKVNEEAARVWISGLEAVKRKIGINRVIDLSATPFFLSGSGYAEGTLFPWTASDFSLLDAIECGIVKLPRVPVIDDFPQEDMPMYRELWKHIGRDVRKMKKKDPPNTLPVLLQNALEALYGHYKETFEAWSETEHLDLPPCFIIVCNDTKTSKLVYDYVSGYYRKAPDGSQVVESGALPLFSNFDADAKPLARPNTLLIDSRQLESGGALDPAFRKVATKEIELFRQQIVERTGDKKTADSLKDQDLLREVMNTVGKKGQLGESVRCVVSVSMLTEGWDANTVTHVMGVRAFGTQLLCEQVVGRALRRQSYDLNDEGLFDVEYADVLGIPFDFTAKPVIGVVLPPKPTVLVKAIRPERDSLEIRFPKVAGYRVELPQERLEAKFDEDSRMELNVGPTQTVLEGVGGKRIVMETGQGVYKAIRRATVEYTLAKHLAETRWQDADGFPKLHLFGQLKRIARQWLDGYLICPPNTYEGHITIGPILDEVCDIITDGITLRHIGERPVKAVLHSHDPQGSTNDVYFRTRRENLHKTAEHKSHVNYAVCDSGWERTFCEIVEEHPRVKAYVKNDGLDFEVPYRLEGEAHIYIPDFIVRIDDGRGPKDLLNLVVEIKGKRKKDAVAKKKTMDAYWVPGVNNLQSFGRWDFAEYTDVNTMSSEFYGLVESLVVKSREAA